MAAGDVQRIQDLLQTFKLPVHGQGEDVSKIVRLMQRDKKAKAGKLYFVLTPRLGDAKITNKIRPFSVIRILKQVLG
jgi:3-dehydroquinate synthase